MKNIKIEKYAEKQITLQEKFMRAKAIEGIIGVVRYSILTAQEILAEVKRESRLYCK